MLDAAPTIAVESRAAAFAAFPAGAHELQGRDPSLAVELGELLSGPAGPPAAGLTVYKSVGVAIEDVAAASLVYEKAKDRGIGTTGTL
jgi:ornithine cyclodeaminase/alanine dehydrogenase-like protein (mu-crystallin family)